jgi:hypothetical protein
MITHIFRFTTTKNINKMEFPMCENQLLSNNIGNNITIKYKLIKTDQPYARTTKTMRYITKTSKIRTHMRHINLRSIKYSYVSQLTYYKKEKSLSFKNQCIFKTKYLLY